MKELAENYEISGTPRIRAEWNWNHTSMLAEPAKRGARLEVFDAHDLGNVTNSTQMNAVFSSDRLKKELNHNSISWSNNSNTPNIDWTTDAKDNYIPVMKVGFGVQQTFYLIVEEPGTWNLGMYSDDSGEVYVYSADESSSTKVISYYGIRQTDDGFPNTANYTFASKGKYKIVTRMHNSMVPGGNWGIRIGYQSPSMITAGEQMKELSSEFAINPEEKDGPVANPEIIDYTKNERTKDWEAWREHYPVSSIIKRIRPYSGIRYDELNSDNDDVVIMNANDYVQTSSAKPKRFYLVNKKDDLQYRYWKTDEVAQGDGTVGNSTVRVYYNDWVQTNKITMTMNIGAAPSSLSIRYLTHDANGEEVWKDALSPGDTVPIDLDTGFINLYVDENEQWHAQPADENDWVVTKQDYSVDVKAIEFTIDQLSRPGKRAEVIEFSARKQLDVTHRTKSFNLTKTMDDSDWMRIVGQLSANDGEIELSNWDNAFQLDQGLPGEERLKQITERSTRFTFDILYDLSKQGESSEFPVRVATMNSADWSREGEYDYKVNLFDSAKILQNMECPEIYEKNMPTHVLMAQILDSIGFDRYSLDREDYVATSTILDYFANEAEATVWDTLNKISESTMCAMFFDEYDRLQLMTRSEIGKRPNLVDYTLYGEFDDDNPTVLPNISELNKKYDMEANKVTIKWKPRSIKKDKDPLNPTPLTDIVWQSEDTITLQATKLVKPMSYSEENCFWIREEDALKWQWNGTANVNGEIIEWDGKEYQWIDARTGKIYTEVLHSQEEADKRDIKSVYGYNRNSVNKFTGRILLKRDKKTGAPIGRATDASGYRVDHPVTMRPGWVPSRFTIGDPGFVPGYWPGEQSTSFYQINGAESSSSAIGINRPTNANDDWFKTQAMYRSASNSVVLQQWGFRVKFLESTTIGEVSLMFNMGMSIGNNSEFVTTALGPTTFNQMYHITFLETQNLVRNATHEIGAWVQTPDPVYRTWDNAIRGSASRMYNRNYWESWEDRMKGYRHEFKRNQWYDIKVDLTRGRGYTGNESMHFFVWVDGMPLGGFDAAGPPDRHKFLAPTNYWAIGCRAASKLQISNAYSWTEFSDPLYESENYRYDFTQGGYVSSYLEDGILYPAKGKSRPYRDGAQFDGEFFFDDMGSTLHEIREFDLSLDKAPVEAVSAVISNENIRCLDLSYSPNKAKFTVVNVSETDQIAQGSLDLEGGGKVDHSMVLYGYVLQEGEEQTTSRKDLVSIKDRGEVAMDIEGDWLNTKNQADDLAKWIVQHFSDPKDVINVTVFGDSSFSVGDKVSIHYKKAEIDPEWIYVVSESNITYDADGGLDVSLELRRVRDNKLSDEDITGNEIEPPVITPVPESNIIGAVSGLDTSTWTKGKVAGTDLLIPFVIENGSVGFLAGDSFSGPMPGAPDWRSPVGFRSNIDPTNNLIVFDSAYRTPGNANANQIAPEIIPNAHSANEWNPFGAEFTVIPNDGFAFNSTGRQIVSYMSVNRWKNPSGNMIGIPGNWRTNYAALAFTDNGNDFQLLERTGDNAWWPNNVFNTSPFQMQSWQDGMDGYMYMISVKAGRQTTPVYLQRVPWDKTFWLSNYQGWNKNILGIWSWGGPNQCTSLFPQKVVSEPSFRRLQDGTWAMAYLTNTIAPEKGGPFGIVTRKASSPTGPWSEEKVQLTQAEVPNLYGGFIHPYSKSGKNQLTLMVSQWTDQKYHVLQVRTTL